MPKELMTVNMDIVTRDGAIGNIANSLVSGGLSNFKQRQYLGDDGLIYLNAFNGGNPKKMASYREICINNNPYTFNANAVLRRDEWKQLDEAIMDVSRQRLGGFDDLISRGLTYNLGNAMGTTVLEWHDVSEALSVALTMDGVTRGPNDQLKFQTNYLPIPILHVDYEINTRHLEASRKLGNPLDTTLAERATRRIKEKLEDMLFTDVTYTWGTADDRSRNKIYSYLNFPDRNTVNLSVAWNSSGITGALILQDVLEMVQASVDAYHYGPWVLYVPTAYQTALYEDYQSGYPKTIASRILEIEGIEAIKVVDRLTSDNVLLVEMKKDTVRVINGFGPTNLTAQEEFGMLAKFKVMAIQVPQIRSDQNGKCGIVHLS